MKFAIFLFTLIGCSLAKPRLGIFGIGKKELSDEVYVEINNEEEVRLNLNDGKGSLRLVKGGFGKAAEHGRRRTISTARISKGPMGVKCFFAGERDDESWLSPVFPKYRTYEDPFFATDLWCFQPIDDVVRIMVSKEAEKVEMIGVELLESNQGGTIFGRGKVSTVERAQIVDGPSVTCTLNSRPTRPGNTDYSRSDFSSTNPLYGSPVLNAVSIVCSKSIVIYD